MTSITFENASVRYPVYNSTRQRSFASSITGAKVAASSILALRDVNLKIEEGERVGLIGHNGAGKTTLLRMMGGMIVPTSGRVTVRGKPLCLLNISAGFEPDKTAYENARFVAKMFGLKGPEIKHLVEDVEDFCELGQFMSMPIRTYSAGMSMRLAFAVYTALPHDILVVDEIIGAGDAKFHTKAAARIKGIIANAKILVMATHNPETLVEYCERAIWMSGGQVAADGTPYDCWQQYETAA